MPEVTDYQAYAGTAAPINFNGLVRQYYLRTGPEVGDIQVNLVDKHHRDRKSHDIALGVRPAIEAIARQHGANVKVVEVPPGPPVMSPIVAEVYGPDYDGQIAGGQAGARASSSSPTHRRHRRHRRGRRPASFVLRVLQSKAALMGVAQKDIVAVMRMGLSGEDVTPMHDSGAKYEIPVRITLPPERQSEHRRAAQAQGARQQTARWCRCPNWST